MRTNSISAVLLCASFGIFFPLGASAQQASFVQPQQHDVITIADIALAQGFYGELADFPHTYAFTIEEPATLFAEILVPDIDSATNDKSGLILESLPDDAGVREVKRLPAKDAAWGSFYGWLTGDSYRRGPAYYDSLEPGSYLIEVSTPMNQGKYVLVVGKREDRKRYIATLMDIARTKAFFEKPKIAMLQSPLVSVPLLIAVVFGYVVFRIMRKRFWTHRRSTPA